jgi:hypothetical protein
VAQRILRHAQVTITLDVYTEVTDEATREALRDLGENLGDGVGDQGPTAGGGSAE